MITAVSAKMAVLFLAFLSAGEPDRAAQTQEWNFDEAKTGAPPVGWIVRETNPKETIAVWRVVADSTAPSSPNVFALAENENENGTFNLALAKGTAFKDIDLTVRVRAVEGAEDQGGGPVWRCRDENNYYVCRFNPLESNYRVYRVVKGKRKQLASARVKMVVDRWYTIRVVMTGSRIACYFDGDKLLEVVDDTFGDAGMVGLWTKADAVTSFDDLTVRTPGEEKKQPEASTEDDTGKTRADNPQ